MNVESASMLVVAVSAAVSTRRPMVLKCVDTLHPTENESQLVDIVSGLLRQVMDWEDYNRRVEFVMKCMEGDLRGQMKKCMAVRQGEADDGNGFVPATDAIGFGEGDD
jgi:hypothetical protein